MTLATLIHQAEAEGVSLTLSVEGKLKAAGNHDAISRWLPIIQQHKPEIIQTLRAANDEPRRDEAMLARLVARVCRAYDFLDDEIKEAIDKALADYEAAEINYRALARKMGMSMNDDRRCCFECAELSGSFCMAARRGEIDGADRRYEPMPYQPKRCDHFLQRVAGTTAADSSTSQGGFERI